MAIRVAIPGVLAACLLNAGACTSTGGVTTSAGLPSDAGTSSDAGDPCELLASTHGDAVAFGGAPDEFGVIVRGTMPDANGFIGENHAEGRMISARFQEGVGLALRVAIVRGDAAAASAMLHGIEAGLATVDPTTGAVISIPPADAGQLTPTDAVSAAAFFLGDACLGLRAAASAPAAMGLGARADAQTAVAKKAIAWLRAPEQVSLLKAADADAPNRLLFDARSFLACGKLTGDDAAVSTAASFVSAATALQRADGVFVENGGSDTNYQSVSVRNALDVASVGNAATCADLFPRALAGARWLAGRVRPDGTVDSSGNTRTCAGGETFLGKPKVLGIVVFFEALAEAGALAPDAFVATQGKLVADYYIQNPHAGTCN